MSSMEFIPGSLEPVPTFPLSHASRHKRRRWPLVLRFVKGAIHIDILFPLVMHAAWTALVAWLNYHYEGGFEVPQGIIPSMSIVVGLMLVFRNQTSYDRFWTGRNNLTTIITTVRSLTRSFLCLAAAADRPFTHPERAATDKAVRTLVAIMYAVKHHLRAEWGSSFEPLEVYRLPRDSHGSGLRRNTSFARGLSAMSSSFPTHNKNLRVNSDAEVRRPTTPRSAMLSRRGSAVSVPVDYADLLPPNLDTLEDRGLSLPLQLACHVETYINKLGMSQRVQAPMQAYLSTQLSNLVATFSQMETIRLTPLPVAHLIHQKQVLALYLAVLPFAMVRGMGWWAIPMVSLVTFTLYGIEGIGAQLEDPFGHDRNDIRMDDIVEDIRVETSVLLQEWREAGGVLFEDGRPNLSRSGTLTVNCPGDLM